VGPTGTPATVPATQPTTAPAPAAHGGSRVTVDADGVLAVDGTKVFPIGLTLPPPPDGKAPNGKDAFDELRAAGVTFIRTGPTGAGRWDDAALDAEQRYEDAAARH